MSRRPGLDPLMAKSIHDLIVMTQRKFGFTAVMVSHEIPEDIRDFGLGRHVAEREDRDHGPSLRISSGPRMERFENSLQSVGPSVWIT